MERRLTDPKRPDATGGFREVKLRHLPINEGGANKDSPSIILDAMTVGIYVQSDINSPCRYRSLIKYKENPTNLLDAFCWNIIPLVAFNFPK